MTPDMGFLFILFYVIKKCWFTKIYIYLNNIINVHHMLRTHIKHFFIINCVVCADYSGTKAILFYTNIYNNLRTFVCTYRHHTHILSLLNFFIFNQIAAPTNFVLFYCACCSGCCCFTLLWLYRTNIYIAHNTHVCTVNLLHK